ncbi:MAG: hypothetical protein ACSLE6_15865 [Mycobacterium sp.]
MVPAAGPGALAARDTVVVPGTKLSACARVVDENDGASGQQHVLTSAGVAARIGLWLQIIRSDYGSQVANAVARHCVVPPWRQGGQTEFIRMSPSSYRLVYRGH